MASGIAVLRKSEFVPQCYSSSFDLLDFINSVTNYDIENLAEADQKGYVKSVKEIFFDFVPKMPDLFSLELPLISSKSDHGFL